MPSHQRLPWPRVLAEGMAIVVSILLAFGIQAWWELRQQRLQQHSDLGALVEEFHATQTRLQNSLDWHRRIEAAAEEFEQRLQPNGPSASVSIPDTLIALVLAMPTLDLPTADLQHLQAAVDLSAIDDADLRQRLTLFSRVIEDQNEAESRGSELVRSRLSPELGRQVDISRIWLSLFAFIVSRDSAMSKTSTAVSPTTALRSILGERAFYEADAASGVARAMERVDRIIEDLEAYTTEGAL